MMKNVKTILGLLSLTLFIALTSCDNINTDTVPIEDLNTVASTSRLRFVNTRDYDTSGMDNWEELSTVPAAILEYITNNHPDEVVEEAWLTNTGEYIVLLDDDTVLVFNASEQFIISFNLEAYSGSFEDDFEEVDSASLPKAILDYLLTNHAGIEIDLAGLNATEEEYVVVLESGVVLIFDLNGNLLDEFTEDDYDEYEEVDNDSLSQAIKDYLLTNYAGIAIDFAVFDTEEEEYIVYLDNGVIVIFDKDGNFLEEDEDDGDYEDDCDEVDIADLPSAITDYIATNYAGEQIEEAWFDSDEKQYYIELSNDLVLIFNEDGSFVGEYTDDNDDDD